MTFPRLRTIALAIPVAFCLFGTLAAQAVPFAQVEVFNSTPHDGTTLADVVIPLVKGRTKVAPALVTRAGRVCQVEPMGARWPDGSLRYLRVEMSVAVTAYQRKRVDLDVYTGSPQAFRLNASLGAELSKIGVWFRANNQRIRFDKLERLEDGHQVQVFRSRLRVPKSSLWAELILLVPTDQAHIRFYLSWGNSNPRTQDLADWPSGVALEVQGIKLDLDQARPKVLSRQTSTDGKTNVVLLHYDGNPIADGQAQAFEGFLYLEKPAPRIRALAHGWGKSMAFGPFGEIFPDVPVSDTEFETMLAEDAKKEISDPWAPAVHGCNPDPRNTGAQSDFGVIVMREDLVRTDPRRLGMIARSVYQEYCRPTHHLNYDLSLVTLRNHPKLLTIGARPHFRAAVWVDRLGKPARYISAHEYARAPDGRRFLGHDDQHLSINYLCAFALTTGDRLARLECERQVEWWLGEFTINSGTYNDQTRAARASGRSLMAACWLWLVTGRDDLRQRIEARTKRLWTGLQKPRTGDAALLPGTLVPRFKLPDGHFWAPWEEALATIGAIAVHKLFKLPEALKVASTVSTNLVTHGIGVTSRGWRIGYFVPFAGDLGTAYFALTDVDFEASRSAGSGLTSWAMPAIAVAARHSASPLVRSHATRILLDLAADSWFMGFVSPFDWLGVLPRK